MVCVMCHVECDMKRDTCHMELKRKGHHGNSVVKSKKTIYDDQG